MLYVRLADTNLYLRKLQRTIFTAPGCEIRRVLSTLRQYDSYHITVHKNPKIDLKYPQHMILYNTVSNPTDYPWVNLGVIISIRTE